MANNPVSSNIDVSKFRNRCTFLNNTGQVPLGAGFVDGYEAFVTTWGLLRQNSGARNLLTGEIILENNYTLYTRYQIALDNNLKSNTLIEITVQGVTRTFTITSITKVEEIDLFYSFQLKQKDH